MADELLNLADEPVENTVPENTTEASESAHASSAEHTPKTPAEKKKYIHDLKKKKEDERKALLKAEREEQKRIQRELDRASGKTGRRRAVFIVFIVAVLLGGGAYYYIKTPKKPVLEQPKPKAEVVSVKDSIAQGIDQIKAKLTESTETAKPKGKWGISGPCFVISHSSVKKEDLAVRAAKKLSYEGFSTGYYWIPDISAGGNPFYKVYVGPFATEEDAIAKLEEVRKYSKKAYIVEIK